mmetsp:Transcript_7311/g.14620  ORF Transcript_7311/g.14620 Transcript_7311/m.14620 type:complete len:232 (+) Transcript_7311:33-728(+)|eukprot:CAMPEP_0119071192 /NCGR_PEP_ID=MMETSP1178-20130426/48511_1 /TAXON_ID=33656 /ORGANISM="unid sp, Strain CCMP2000" /LENGTH=231 /DNA_ID=CAMNT_0007053097 /DNA_START=26 /DNA_END=721 /DNA_ORIENTATION=-
MIGPAVTTAALKDFSGPAAGLFGNMRVPAALVAGASIPMGLIAGPKLAADDPPKLQALKTLHALLAVTTLSNQLLVVLWSTIAVNKLSEVAAPPAVSLMAFISRDYEMAWIGCNVHFLSGILTLCCMAGLNMHINYGAAIGRAASLLTSSTVLFMTSIVNEGVAQGDGTGGRLGASVFSLACRYVTLLVSHVAERRGYLLVAALALALAASYYACRALLGELAGELKQKHA